MERQGFYQGQSIAPEHLEKLQDYTDNKQANLVSALLGYGVVNGLEISYTEGDQHNIAVSAGLAFNLAGERLVLAGGQRLDLVQYRPNSDTRKIKIGIVLDYIKTEPVTDDLQQVVYTKCTPTVEFIIGESLADGVFELAEITLNAVAVESVQSTAPNFTTLYNQIENTKALSNMANGSILQAKVLELLGIDRLDLNSPIINMITDMLQINGTPYMEIGSNDNGHYVKFESGLLICVGVEHSNTSSGGGWGYFLPFPHVFTTLFYQTLTNLHRNSSSPNYYLYNASSIDSLDSLLQFNLIGVASHFVSSSSYNRQFSAKGVAVGMWK